MPSVYLDSCLVIHLIEGPKAVRDAVTAALQPTQAPAPSVHVSDLTRLECRVRAFREGNRPLLDRYDAFFAAPEVICLSCSAAAFDLATEFRAGHRLKTPDALHLAVAVVNQCDELWTRDDRLSAAAAERIRVRSTFV